MSSLTPQEFEFISEDDLIDIVPLFSMEKVRLMTGLYGPFRPPGKTRVPVWMAINLKSKRKCHIVPPEWLSVENLQQKLQDETTLQESFAELPDSYLEISKLILDAAPDNLAQPSLIRSLIKDILTVRQAKIRQGLLPKLGVDESGIGAEYMQLTNITPLELSTHRPFLIQAMGMMAKLAPGSVGEGKGAGPGGTQADEEEEDGYY